MAAATAQGTYINPMAALATQIPHALNGDYIYFLVSISSSFLQSKSKKCKIKIAIDNEIELYMLICFSRIRSTSQRCHTLFAITNDANV